MRVRGATQKAGWPLGRHLLRILQGGRVIFFAGLRRRAVAVQHVVGWVGLDARREVLDRLVPAPCLERSVALCLQQRRKMPISGPPQVGCGTRGRRPC